MAIHATVPRTPVVTQYYGLEVLNITLYYLYPVPHLISRLDKTVAEIPVN